MHSARYSIDWLSVTFPDSKAIPSDYMLGKWKFAGKGLHGYTAKWIDQHTGAIFQASGTSEMGAHLTLSGGTMRNLHISGRTDSEIINRVLDRNGRVSRIDLAMDIFGSDDLTVANFAADYAGGGVVTRAKSGLMVDEKTGNRATGATFYLGKRSSEKFLRVYDKALEQHVQDAGAWLRLELELKALLARGAAGAIREHGCENVVKGHIVNMANWRRAEFQELISQGGIGPESGKRRDTKTEQWLTGVVAKTLARAINENPEIWDKFLDALTTAQRELNRESESSGG